MKWNASRLHNFFLRKLDLNNKEIRENILAAFKEIHQALYSGDQEEVGFDFLKVVVGRFVQNFYSVINLLKLYFW